MQRHHAHPNRNKFRRCPTPPVVQSLVAGAQAHPRAAAVLRAVFVADERAFTGARCELPLGEVVEVTGRKTPFFALCRELDKRGYGDCRISHGREALLLLRVSPRQQGPNPPHERAVGGGETRVRPRAHL